MNKRVIQQKQEDHVGVNGGVDGDVDVGDRANLRPVTLSYKFVNGHIAQSPGTRHGR